MSGDSFVFYPTFYIEADEDISIEQAYRINNAIARFGVRGELPSMEGWRQWERVIVEAAMAQISAQKKNREDGKKGGRPEKEVPPEELAQKYAELGSWRAVAEHFGISERSVYNKRGCAKPVEAVENSSAKTAKSNVNVNVNENGNVCVPAEGEKPKVKSKKGAHTISKSSVAFPAERTQAEFNPPTVGEVELYIKQKGYDAYGISASRFVNWWQRRGWLVTPGICLCDWRADVDNWAIEDAKKASKEEKARASPGKWIPPEIEEDNLTDEEAEAMLERINAGRKAIGMKGMERNIFVMAGG